MANSREEEALAEQQPEYITYKTAVRRIVAIAGSGARNRLQKGATVFATEAKYRPNGAMIAALMRY